MAQRETRQICSDGRKDVSSMGEVYSGRVLGIQRRRLEMGSHLLLAKGVGRV